MTIKTVFTAAAIALTLAAPARAAPIELDFAFGSTTGTFFGLDNEEASSIATSFDIMGPPGTFLDKEVSTFVNNRNFFFSNGDLIGGIFDFGFTDPNNLDDTISVGLNFNQTSLIDGTARFEFIRLPSSSLGQVRDQATTATFTTRLVNPAPVPLPAGGVLLLTALGGIGLWGRRTKN